ncbi:MAG: HAMP domain-containing protein [Chloroflexi bacterium]|nr:HAMP domain-containing protein [Chloroflexota bacterium]
MKTQVVDSTARTIHLRAPSLGLGAKLAIAVIVSTLALIGLFAYLGTAALNESTERTLQERVVLAQTTADYVDAALANIQHALTGAAQEQDWFADSGPTPSLQRAYSRLNYYATQVFLVDDAGTVIAAEPPLTGTISLAALHAVAASLSGQTFSVSRHVQTVAGLPPAPMAAVPVYDASGRVRGALVMNIALEGSGISIFSHPSGLGLTGYMDLVDASGVILASTRVERLGRESDHGQTLSGMIVDHRQAVSACHDCHTHAAQEPPQNEVLAFAPLASAPWGVAVRQSESEVFQETRLLQTRIFALLAIALAGALALVYATTRSVIRPIRDLIAATRRIAAGDLETPVEVHRRDELGALARSFDTMRVRLQGSMRDIQQWNRELDTRVRDRTAALAQAAEENARLYAELQTKEQLRSELLHRVISVQEEERKRISRELHDDTCQILTGLSYALDNASEACDSAEVQALLEKMHGMTDAALDEVYRIIFDLRPTMLDHLGFISALRWYAETRLLPLDVRFTLREIGDARRLPPAIETVLFRVVQEAINNIARHSRAPHASFVFQFADDCVEARIADDGDGFDVAQVTGASAGKRGLGLLGMEERMGIVSGTLRLRSAPGAGTVIRLHVPLDRRENGKR